jgi:hypothetical protein
VSRTGRFTEHPGAQRSPATLSGSHSIASIGTEALACEIEVDCADRTFEKATMVGPPGTVKGLLWPGTER